MYESSLSAKWNLGTRELKVWRHAAAYTKANSYFPCFFLTFSAYGYSLLPFLIYTLEASKIQIRIEATSVQDFCRQNARLTRK